MKTVWTKGLNAQDAQEIKLAYQASGRLRERLTELLDERKRHSYESSFSKDMYDSPNWAYLQADARGYERAMNEILSLIENKTK